MSEARKQVPSAVPAQAPDEATPEQLEARRELLALILQHNPAPTPEQLAEIDREWDQG